MSSLETRIRDLADNLDIDAAEDEAARDALVAESPDHPDLARLGAIAEITRGIADDIRRALDGAS